MDFLDAQLAFLADHPFGVVFWSAFVEAVGIPFPSRVILILTPAFLTTDGDLARLIAAGAAGAVLGDHVPYLAGRLAGTRLLSWSLPSRRCWAIACGGGGATVGPAPPGSRAGGPGLAEETGARNDARRGGAR